MKKNEPDDIEPQFVSKLFAHLCYINDRLKSIPPDSWTINTSKYVQNTSIDTKVCEKRFENRKLFKLLSKFSEITIWCLDNSD